MLHGIDDATLEDLYAWIDGIPLSRPKRNIARDFADGVLIAELVKYFEPKLVELHNYTPANKETMKSNNWLLLNRKVFTRSLRFELKDDVIRNITISSPGAIEHFLLMLRGKLEEYAAQNRSKPQPKIGRGHESDKPESDQYLVLIDDEPFVCKVDILEKIWTTGIKNASPKGKGSHLHPGTNRGFPNLIMEPQIELIASHNIDSLNNPPPATKNPRTKAVRGILETDAITRRMFEEKEQECIAKDETINILRAKVERLEHLIHLKDVRIQDLSGRLETSRPTGINKDVQRKEPSDRRYHYAK